MAKDGVIRKPLLCQLLGPVLAHARPEMAMGLLRDLGRGGIQAFDDAAPIAEDQTGSAAGGLQGAGINGPQSGVVLPAGGVAKMPVRIGRSGHVGQGVGAGSHRLGTQRLQVPAAGHFTAHHRAHVLLQGEVVHNQHTAALSQDAELAAVGPAIRQQGSAGCRHQLDLLPSRQRLLQGNGLPRTTCRQGASRPIQQPPRSPCPQAG